MGVTWTRYLNKTIHPAPLAGFRLTFGIVMLIKLVLFWKQGYIESYYILPEFHFSFYALDWIQPLGHWTYVIFGLCVFSALGIMLGYKYRWSVILFFLSFTYMSLMDVAVYYNQYYFISVLSFLMIFLPCNAAFSLDSLWSRRSFKTIPFWCVDTVKWLLVMVFVFKGLGTLNSDWLLHGEPFKIWLKLYAETHTSAPQFFQSAGFAKILSWSFSMFCLSFPLLFYGKKTRFISFIILLIFHFIFHVLLPENVLPILLVLSTLIFFGLQWHYAVIRMVRQLLSPIQYGLKLPTALKMTKDYAFHLEFPKIILGVYFIILLVLPLRYLSYPGELLWTEEGLRWSWRYALMHKTGKAVFSAKDGITGTTFTVDNAQFLTSEQERNLRTNPNLMLQYAHKIGEYYGNEGIQNVQVFVTSTVGLNGRLEEPFINPEVDLFQQEINLKHKDWILPFSGDIKGL
ncbi:HTTM domain-containing protein [Formosa sp. S-31]|uniref:HTTM domain-containing protein n=1 Tax=Formosa sp. S-31 TaxID=2790949 RepID=UPI003EBBAF90